MTFGHADVINKLQNAVHDNTEDEAGKVRQFVHEEDHCRETPDYTNFVEYSWHRGKKCADQYCHYGLPIKLAVAAIGLVDEGTYIKFFPIVDYRME